MSNISLETVAKSGGVVKSMVSDLAGGLREIIFPAQAVHELCTTGIAYDGSSFQGINDINASDAILMGDKETIVKVPASIAETEAEEYWVMCDIYTTDGFPHPNCARSRLKIIQAELAEVWDGGNMMVGAEPEAFFVQNQEHVGTGSGGNSNYF